jgi:hypothetical protein
VINRFFLKPLKAINPNRLFAKLVLLLLACGIISPAFAQGLVLAPTRIIFQPGERSAEVAITNKGARTAKFRIFFENKSFGRGGEVEVLTEERSGFKFADPMLRLSTREVTLKPGQEQIVRIMLRRSEDMADGEYRSHFTVRAVIDNSQPQPSVAMAAGTNEQGKEFVVNLVPQYGIAIPVLVRQGVLDAQLKVKKTELLPAVQGSAGRLGIDLEISGNRSLFANMTLVDKSKKGKDAQLFVMRNLSIYAPGNARYMLLDLNQKMMDAIKGGKVSLFAQEVDPTSGELLKEEMEIPIK